MGGAALVALSLLLDSRASRRPPSRRRSARPAASLRAGTFTPAVADPRLAAELARRGSQASSFRFTPAPTAVNRSQSIRVAIRARAATPAGALRRAADASATPVTAITPTVYNLGASIGWKRFALSGDVDSVKGGALPGGREAAEVGRQLFGQPLHRPRRGRGRPRRSGDSADHRRGRELHGRGRRLLPDHPQPRCHRRRPLQDPARPARGRSPTSAATARPSTSAPPSASKRGPGVDPRPAIDMRQPPRPVARPCRRARSPAPAPDAAIKPKSHRSKRSGARMRAGGERRARGRSARRPRAPPSSVRRRSWRRGAPEAAVPRPAVDPVAAQAPCRRRAGAAGGAAPPCAPARTACAARAGARP